MREACFRLVNRSLEHAPTGDEGAGKFSVNFDSMPVLYKDAVIHIVKYRDRIVLFA